MSATQDNLARWREAEQGATEGPWWPYPTPEYVGGPADDWTVHSDASFVCATHIHTDRGERDATFIATARTAMPALLAFAEAVLAEVRQMRDLHEKHGAGQRLISCTALASLAEVYLGTTYSTPTTGERSVEPAAVTGSGRTADTGGLDSPGVGTSTTTTEGTNA